jgi:hypothetical protein
VHDGEALAVHLSWEDATKDDELLGHETFSDAAALQHTSAPDPPLFMGAPDAPVDVAYWKAAWERDASGVRAIDDRYPATPPDLLAEVPPEVMRLYLTARAAGNAQAAGARPVAAETLRAVGLGTLGPSAQGPRWSARGAWSSGFWDVVLVRPIAGEGATLAPGARSLVAFGVWDGAHGDRNGQKVVSVWHVLELER